MSLYLSRLTLSKQPSVAALGALLTPSDSGQRLDAHHRLLWSAFAGDPTASRDFLWREDGRGTFMVLSKRPPEQSPLFEPAEVKEFAPDLKPGDRLKFLLRANATRTEKTGEKSVNGKEKKRHIDLVMDSLPPKGERAEARMQVAQKVAESWLQGQGERNGFTVDQVQCTDYSVSALPMHRGSRKHQPQFGILDLSGVISVIDPAAFLARVGAGFGRAKAFGCGLMLIRRAP